MISEYLYTPIVEELIELKDNSDDQSKRRFIELKSLLIYRHGLNIMKKINVFNDDVGNQVIYINTNYENQLNPDYKFYGESDILKEDLIKGRYIKFYELKEDWDFYYDLEWIKSKMKLLEETFVNPDLSNREQFEYLTIDQQKVNEFDYDDDAIIYYSFLIENQKH